MSRLPSICGGCGESEGEHGRVDPSGAGRGFPQCIDPPDAASLRRSRTHRVIGSSFGGAVAVMPPELMIAARPPSSAWWLGDGERKFRGQHKSAQEWARFTKMLEDGREHRARTGKSLMVPRYDIVPIPPHLRSNLASNSIEAFPAETAQSMFDFRADDVVGRIAPRPLLLLHAANDFGHPDRAIDRAVQARRAARRAAPHQRCRPFHARRIECPHLGPAAGLARQRFARVAPAAKRAAGMRR